MVRGLISKNMGKLRQPAWKGNTLHFAYDGIDGYSRSLNVSFSPAPTAVNKTTANFHFKLEPEEPKKIQVLLALQEGDEPTKLEIEQRARPVRRLEDAQKRDEEEWVAQHMRVHTDNPLFNKIIEQAFRDLRVLRTDIRGEEFFAAGVPWFATLFGRDSIITALQTLAYDPSIAVKTLRLLATYQGKQVDTWRDEEPGKILHELRVGELARSDEIPHTPYYGTVDATPLFLVLMAEYIDWTGNTDLFRELEENIDLALNWTQAYADLDGDGYAEYTSDKCAGLANKGWKDSGDAMLNADGSLAEPPIALVEVQAYMYQAKVRLTNLYEEVGDIEKAKRLRSEAQQLKRRFNRDFWLADEKIYALALQGKDKRPVAVVSSNPGHALWSGIADNSKAKEVVRRLMAQDMFSGWGIRTLSDREKPYSPIGYHLGTVWPHDNSLIAAGFRGYGFESAANRIFDGLLDAAANFPKYQMPEAFAGFPRVDYGVPVRYPVACHPQAWAAGALLYLLADALGLRPRVLEGKLVVVRPTLPRWVENLEIRDVHVGNANVDLIFRRKRDDSASLEDAHVRGKLEVIEEQ